MWTPGQHHNHDHDREVALTGWLLRWYWLQLNEPLLIGCYEMLPVALQMGKTTQMGSNENRACLWFVNSWFVYSGTSLNRLSQQQTPPCSGNFAIVQMNMQTNNTNQPPIQRTLLTLDNRQAALHEWMPMYCDKPLATNKRCGYMKRRHSCIVCTRAPLCDQQCHGISHSTGQATL